MDQECRIVSPRMSTVFRHLIRALFALGTTVLLATATTASGAEVISLAPTSTSPDLRPQVVALPTHGTKDSDVRKALEAVTRYPNRPEARNGRLQGKVTVAFLIDRNGKLQEAEILESSGSRILDHAALASVHMARYQALPADSDGRFQMTFDYRFAP